MKRFAVLVMSLLIGCGGKIEATDMVTPTVDPGTRDVNADARILHLPTSATSDDMITEYTDGWRSNTNGAFYRYSESNIKAYGTFTALVLDPEPSLLVNGAPVASTDHVVYSEVAGYNQPVSGCVGGRVAEYTRVTKLAHMTPTSEVDLISLRMTKYRDDAGTACWALQSGFAPSDPGTCFCDAAETPSDATLSLAAKAVADEVSRQSARAATLSYSMPKLWSFAGPQLTMEMGHIVNGLVL